MHRGRVRLEALHGDAPHVLGHAASKQCFGEMAVLEDAPRMATAIAAEDTTAIRFPRQLFQKRIVAGDVPALRLAYAVARALCARVRGLNRSLLAAGASAEGPG